MRLWLELAEISVSIGSCQSSHRAMYDISSHAVKAAYGPSKWRCLGDQGANHESACHVGILTACVEEEQQSRALIASTLLMLMHLGYEGLRTLKQGHRSLVEARIGAKRRPANLRGSPGTRITGTYPATQRSAGHID